MGKLSDELIRMLGLGFCDHTLSFKDAIYIFHCFNYNWQLACTLRQYSTRRLLKCYIALEVLLKIKERSNRGTMDINEVNEK